MEVAGWAGEGEEEDGRVKLQKGCRKKKCRDRNGGNAPAPLGLTKLPRDSVSVWAWTSGLLQMGLVCPGTPCHCWLVLCQPWPLPSLCPMCSSAAVCLPPPQAWKALGCRVEPGPLHSSLFKQKPTGGMQSKQAGQQSKQPRFVFVWLEWV